MEAWTTDFMKGLFDFRHKIQKENKMPEVNAYITAHFEKFPTAMRTGGRIHKAQLHGSCAVRSVTSYLNEHLNPKVYRAFKVFSTRDGCRSFKKDLLVVSAKEQKERLKEAEIVLEKRTKKAKQIGSPEAWFGK